MPMDAECLHTSYVHSDNMPQTQSSKKPPPASECVLCAHMHMSGTSNLDTTESHTYNEESLRPAGPEAAGHVMEYEFRS